MWGQKWGTMIWGSVSPAVPAVSGGMLLLLSLALLVVGYRLGKRERAPRWLPWLTGLAAALLPTAIVSASTFTVPVTFSNGTVADATQVNQDLSAISTELDRLRKPTMTLSECDFRSRLSSSVVLCGEGTGGAFVFDASDSAVVAPLHVPSGATINSIDVYVNDTNSSDNLQVCMWGAFDTFGSFSMPGSCVSTSGTPGITMLTLTPGVVQGGDPGQAYELFVFSQTNAGASVNWPSSPNQSTLAVRSAYVHYELP